MVEIKVEVESNNGDVEWSINLYSNNCFIKTICTCYEEDYVNMLSSIIAEKRGAKLKMKGGE